jgi:signal peptidase I
MTMQKTIYLIAILFYVLKGSAQPALKIGDWINFLPLDRGTYVTQTPGNIVYASGQAVVLIDKETGQQRSLSKVDGLSDVGVRFVKYYAPLDILVIVYDNSNIDLIERGIIRNFGQIRNNQVIPGDRSVFNLAIANNGSLFLACGFGLVELDLNNLQFGTTTFTPVAVSSFAEFEGYYYMGTQEGLYRINATGGLNLSDFGLWEYMDGGGLIPGINIRDLAVHDGKLYVALNNALFQSSNGSDFTLITQRSGQTILFLSGDAERLITGWDCSGCPKTVETYNSENGTFFALNNFCVTNPRYAIQDEEGTLWLADLNERFRTIPGVESSECQRLNFENIYSSNVSDVAIRKDRIFVASGGITSNASYRFRTDGFFEFDGEKWNAYNNFSVPAFGNRDIRDFVKISLHPDRDTVFVATFYDGLIKWVNEEEFTIYDETNSTLRRGVGDRNRIRIAGMDWDRDKNLWMGNFDGPNPIGVYLNDGTWRSIGVPGSLNLMDVVVDNFNNKWYRVFGAGLLVFNEGNDIDDESGYRFRQITTSNSILPTNGVTSLAMDLDGAIWVGTENGIVVMECGSDPFRAECRGSERFLEQDGFGAILLEGQTITALAIDGGNRKWIGTTNGIFVQSPAGDEPVYNFTVSNSPLLSNSITTITVDDETGLVYIGSDGGLQSFKAEATGGGASFRQEVYAYPNPVRPGYEGPIAIKGLARDANIKITDIEGRLVYEGRATGGQAIWDGRDLSGRRVSTGVYLVFATYTRNLEFPQTHIAKLMVVD